MKTKELAELFDNLLEVGEKNKLNPGGEDFTYHDKSIDEIMELTDASNRIKEILLKQIPEETVVKAIRCMQHVLVAAMGATGNPYLLLAEKNGELTQYTDLMILGFLAVFYEDGLI